MVRTTTHLAFLSLVVILAGPLGASAWAEPLDTEIIFIAGDADLDDRLGQAIAISGNVAIVGANRNDDNGSNSGSVYLIDVTTGGELFKLTASDADASDIFGHSVGISGNTAIVSSQNNADAGDQSGSAYLFDVTTGNELFKLTASDGAERDFFGHGIGISGNTAIVGAHGDDDNGGTSGSAYLFDVTTGNELFKLTASDGAAGDQFGYWTAISGNIAIVGAKYDDHAGTRSGSAYLFDVTTGNELMKLTASDAAAGDFFGYAVAIDGNTAVVGAYRDDDGGFDAGSVYVFDVTTGDELLKLTASDGDAFDYFGYAVGISDNTVIVGAYGDDDDGSNSGSAYLYDLTFGDELGKWTASDGAVFDEFGTAVAISGNAGVVGAWLHDGAGGADAGQAYLYDVSSALPPGADFNNDGVVNNADLLLWESSSPIPRLDLNGDDQVDGADFLEWQRSFTTEILFDDSPANFDQQGPVDGDDVDTWEQSYAFDGNADLDGDGDTDGADFLVLQRELTPFDAADKNLDRLVDGLDREFWDTSFGWDADIDGDGHLDGDADGDGLVTQRDFLWWQKHSTEPPPVATSVQVPEPASCLLFSGVLVACVVGRRCRCSTR